MSIWRSRILVIFLIALAHTSMQTPALACSVCFGDPQSPMAKGALMGVVTLGAIIVSVLFFIAGTGVYWLHRGARLSQSAAAEGRKP